MTYSDGNPSQVGIVAFGDQLVTDITGGLDAEIVMPDYNQYGFTIPVNCVLDGITLTAGHPALNPPPGQTIHIFAALATANGNSQIFTLHPSAGAEISLGKCIAYPLQVRTVRITDLGFNLKAGTRCMVVCGHYTTGDTGSTSYTFTYSGALLLK